MGRLLSWVALSYGRGVRRGKARAALFFSALAVAGAMAGGVQAQEVAPPVTIAALGDSLTQGYGLRPEDGFVPQLSAWLRDRGAQVALINAGVSGDTTAGGLSRMAWTLTPEVRGVIIGLGGNDMLRGLDPALTRQNLEAMLQQAAGQNVRVLLIGMQAAGNYGPDYKRDFDALYPDLAARYETFFVPSFFAGISDGDLSQAAGLMQADGIHPNPEGVKRIVAGLGPEVLRLAEALGACPKDCALP